MKRKERDYYSDDLKGSDWIGEVILNEDPENLSRVKIRVFGKFDLLEEEEIPWAKPSNNITGGSDSGGGFFSTPKIGSILNCTFDNGNLYTPLYSFHQKPSDELIAEIGEDHQNFHSLIYDTWLIGEDSGETDHLKIFYSTNEEKGFIINLKDTIINIKNDNSFNITNPNEDSIVMTNEGLLDIILSDIFTITVENEYTVNTKVTNFNTEDEFNITTTDTLVKTDSSFIIHSAKIELGESGLEPIVLGDTLKGILDELLDAILQLTVATGVGPSLIPINSPTFVSIKAKLQTILSIKNKTQ